MILLSYLKIFLEKQNGKTIGSICLDIFIRLTSICVFPVLYMIFAFFNLFKPIKLGFLYNVRLGHLALNTDLYLRRRYLGLIPRNELHIFFVYAPANLQLVKMFSREMMLINSEVLFKFFSIFGLLKTRFWIALPFSGNEYEEFHSTPPQITFTAKEDSDGKDFLDGLGISKDQWYVCIFARDNRYYQLVSPDTDVTFSDHRNADINSYRLAIEAIIEAGGWVIRMGSSVEQPLDVIHPRVIDYASKFRTDFADIYITAHARFFVGTTSGASDLCVLFNIPFVGVNWMPIGYSPFGKNSIFIPKRIYDEKSDTQIRLRDQFLAFAKHQVGAETTPDEILRLNRWKLINNSEQEIKDAAMEMHCRLNGSFKFNSRYALSLDLLYELRPHGNAYRDTRTPISETFLLSLDLT